MTNKRMHKRPELAPCAEEQQRWALLDTETQAAILRNLRAIARDANISAEDRASARLRARILKESSHE